MHLGRVSVISGSAWWYLRVVCHGGHPKIFLCTRADPAGLHVSIMFWVCAGGLAASIFVVFDASPLVWVWAPLGPFTDSFYSPFTLWAGWKSRVSELVSCVLVNPIHTSPFWWRSAIAVKCGSNPPAHLALEVIYLYFHPKHALFYSSESRSVLHGIFKEI